MKKTLLTALMLMASAIIAQAQGFRVYRSDGTVYQFSWVADSIAFYEGEGDPNYEEPIPESVQTALRELQTYVANNAMAINNLYESVAENKDRIVRNQTDIKSLKDYVNMLVSNMNAVAADLQNVKNDVYSLQGKVEDNKAIIKALQDYINNVQAQIDESRTRIAMIETVITNMQSMIDELTTRVVQNTAVINDLQGQIYRDRDEIEKLQAKDEQKNIIIEELLDLVEELTARVDDLENR